MNRHSNRRDFLKRTAAGAAALTFTGMPGIVAAQDKRTLTVAWDTDIDTLDPASFIDRRLYGAGQHLRQPADVEGAAGGRKTGVAAVEAR